MPDRWRTWSGLELIQDYVIPNSSRTKNPLYKKLGIDRLTGAEQSKITTADNASDSLNVRLKIRMIRANCLAGLHAAFFAAFATMMSREYIGAEGSLLLVWETYLFANQMDIRRRLKKVLTAKERRLESRMAQDVRKIE